MITRYKVEAFLVCFLLPVVVLGVLLNALSLVFLAKTRLIRRYQLCVFLSIISINNIFRLVLCNGLHWLHLFNRDYYHHLMGSSMFTCQTVHFVRTVFVSSGFLIMSGALVNQLLALQLLSGDGVATVKCCRLPRNSFWRSIAVRFCRPAVTLMFTAAVFVVLVGTTLPILWMYVAREDHTCTVTTDTWSFPEISQYFRVSFFAFWFVFFVSFVAVSPMIVLGSGRLVVSNFRQMIENSGEEEDETRYFIRLLLISSAGLWILTLPQNCSRFLTQIFGQSAPLNGKSLDNTIFILQSVLALYTAVWPLLCLALVPVLRRETRKACISIRTSYVKVWNRRSWNSNDRRFDVRMSNVIDSD